MALQEDAKSQDHTPLDQIIVGDREQWMEGPPYELFKRLRNECPVHWTTHLPEFPGEAGFHSIVRWDDIRSVSMDWQTFSSELGGITALTDAVMPLEMQRGMFIAQDPPRHARRKPFSRPGSPPSGFADPGGPTRKTVGVRLAWLTRRPKSTSWTS